MDLRFRRSLLFALSLVVCSLVSPGGAWAQSVRALFDPRSNAITAGGNWETVNLFEVGYVANANASADRFEAFKAGLVENGFFLGDNLLLDISNVVAGSPDIAYIGPAAEMLALGEDLIVAGNAPAAVAISEATCTIPIVLAAVNDPVGLGVVQSLEHPGTNVTGTTIYAPWLVAERMNVMNRIVPNMDKVSIIMNGGNPTAPFQYGLFNDAATAIGAQYQDLDVRLPTETVPAITAAHDFETKALFNGVDSFINSQRFVINQLCTEFFIPTFFTDREYVLAGGLMSLGPGHLEGYFHAPDYIKAILVDGADPADLPIRSPTEFEFSVSRSKLAFFGLTLPPDIEERVNEWLP